MSSVVNLGPTAILVIGGLGDGLGLGCITCSAGIGLYTFLFTSRLLSHRTTVPSVICGFLLGANRAGVLMSAIIHLGPATIFMIVGLCSISCLSSRAGSTSVLNLTAFFAVCRLNGGAVIPLVPFFLHILTDGAGLSVIGAVQVAPAAVAVVAGNGNACTTRTAGNCSIAGSQAGCARNGICAKCGGIFYFQGDLEDAALNGFIAVHEEACDITRSSGDAGGISAQRCAATAVLKYIFVVAEHKAAAGAGLNRSRADRYGDRITAINCSA